MDKIFKKYGRISLNEKGIEIAEEMMDWSEELKVKNTQLKDGTKSIIDCGINVSGSYDAGLRFVETSMGGLGIARINTEKLGDIPVAFINVTTDHPALSCLISQKADWQINLENYTAIASGPAKSLSLKSVYKKIQYEDDFEVGVIILESDKLPDEKVMQFIKDECSANFEIEDIVALVTPAGSIVGTVQTSGRVIETAVSKLYRLGFDTTKIVCATGNAPVAPVFKDNLKAKGCAYDSIIYYGSVILNTHGFDENIFKKLPSCEAKKYGTSFYDILKEVKGDISKVDHDILAPAKIVVNDLDNGTCYHFGQYNPDILLKSYKIKTI